MVKSPMAMASLLLLAACASAPPPPVEAPPPAQDAYSVQIERRANEMIAADPAGIPNGLSVSVLSVDAVEGGLFYKVELNLPERRAHRGEDYVIYGQCQPDDIDRCASQIIAGARMLK
jgi:hypothetical protein